MEQIVFGAGCFWGVQEILDKVDGVLETVVGYSGGFTDNPNYRDICTGKTGHAEVVLVKYDESKISFAKVLDYYWRLHNPTTLNRQGADVGSQYRSVIFFYSDVQKEIAIKSKHEFDQSGVYEAAAVTEIIKMGEFYPAEEYHQKYFDKNPGKGCHFLRPK